jgi:acyl carrier protein
VGDYEAIFTAVRLTLAKQLEISPESIAEDTRIVQDLGADSLDVVELIMTLEEGYNIIITNEDAAGLQTIGQIVAFIQKQLEKPM